MLSDQDVVRRNGGFFPDVIRAWVEGSAVNHVGTFS